MRVSDPSTASATVNVIVRVTEVNEAPAFDDDAPTLLSVVENADPPDHHGWAQRPHLLMLTPMPSPTRTAASPTQDGSVTGP